jgi:hypothetical protein
MKSGHLVRRFLGALWRAAPDADEEAWARTVLTPVELPLYERLPNHDRRHALRSGRRAEAALGAACEPRWIAAALLHDVGKYDSGFSVPGRAIATVAAGGRSGRRRVERWRDCGGVRRRIWLYARHGEIGADEIRAVGGREVAAVWSEAHHHPEAWSSLDLPSDIVKILDAADQ